MENHFTVIIPTRERIDTLRRCLETCTSQKYDRLRIVVSDNACTDGTTELLQQLASVPENRIDHIRTPKRLSMAENFEFALQYALQTSPQSTYITMMGDDDGLLPRALEHWSAIVSRHPDAMVFTWPLCNYTWPDCIDTATPNVLNFSLRRFEEVIDLREVRKDLATFSTGYTDVARIYYGLVHSDALRKVERGGRLIHSMIPDVYLGCAVTLTADTMVSAGYPMSIVGASKHSTGHLQITGGKSRSKGSTNDWFYQEKNLQPHPVVGATPASIRLCELEVLSQLKDLGFEVGEIEPEGFFRAAIAELNGLNTSKANELFEELQRLATANEWQAELAAVEEGFDRDRPPVVAPKRSEQPFSFDRIGQRMQLDGFAMGLENVSDAVRLCGQVLGYGDHPAIVALALAEKSLFDQLPSVLDDGATLAGAERSIRAMRDAVTAVYRSRRWRWSRFLSMPKHWKSRKSSEQLDRALDGLVEVANELSKYRELLATCDETSTRIRDDLGHDQLG